MRALILMGSPRKNGNTAALLAPFCSELERQGWEQETLWLYEKTIAPCTACRTCQDDWFGFGCAIRDDAYKLFVEWRTMIFWYWQRRFTPGIVRRP